MTSTHLRLLSTPEFTKYCSNTFAFSIPYGTQAVSSIGAKHQARYICNDEANSSSAYGSEITPPWRMALNLWP